MFGLVVLGVLLLMGLIVGGFIQRRHLQDLAVREAETEDMLVSQIMTFPGYVVSGRAPTLLVSEVVICSDFMRAFAFGLRNILGGEDRSFTMMLERARREAILRLKYQARELGYDALCNVRFVTADIAGRASGSKSRIVLAALIGYATAYHLAHEELSND